MLLDLSQNKWRLQGFAPMSWRLSLSSEINCPILSDVDEIEAEVPGSVQLALLNAGKIEDWNVGHNARICEWVENRDWIYESEIPAGVLPSDEPIRLRCDGLDGKGVVLVNNVEVGKFDNAFIPYSFDITRFVDCDTPTKIKIVFYPPPRALGQIAWTSKIVDMKPRFNYGWDWCNRLVQIGIWDKVSLETGFNGTLEGLRCRSNLSSKGMGTVLLRGELDVPDEYILHFAIKELKGGKAIAREHVSVGDLASVNFNMEIENPKLWHPNGCGDRVIYQLHAELRDPLDNIVDERNINIGFRSIKWLSCAEAPAKADPWVCQVNGKAIFLQGVNWTPVRANFADVKVEDVRSRLALYADMGCNFIRVWGGAILEKESFYNICDELGLMVMQEFPLSSSGLDCVPPDDPEVRKTLTEVAASYIIRRQNHPSLIMWSGGNELQWGMNGLPVGKPIGLEHPLLHDFACLLNELDPERRYQPTSPSGPRGFGAEEFGLGLHWDVHGPWHVIDGDLRKQEEFWNSDDALLRSEAGASGATSEELMRRYAGNLSHEPWSLKNDFWRRYYWYFSHENFIKNNCDEPTSLSEFVTWSQEFQAEALAIMARASKKRFPACGGIVLWMGHDACPCPENTSIVNFDGTPKLAVAKLREVFTMKEKVNESAKLVQIS